MTFSFQIILAISGHNVEAYFATHCFLLFQQNKSFNCVLSKDSSKTSLNPIVYSMHIYVFCLAAIAPFLLYLWS